MIYQYGVRVNLSRIYGYHWSDFTFRSFKFLSFLNKRNKFHFEALVRPRNVHVILIILIQGSNQIKKLTIIELTIKPINRIRKIIIRELAGRKEDKSRFVDWDNRFISHDKPSWCSRGSLRVTCDARATLACIARRPLFRSSSRVNYPDDNVYFEFVHLFMYRRESRSHFRPI